MAFLTASIGLEGTCVVPIAHGAPMVIRQCSGWGCSSAAPGSHVSGFLRPVSTLPCAEDPRLLKSAAMLFAPALRRGLVGDACTSENGSMKRADSREIDAMRDIRDAYDCWSDTYDDDLN